MDSDIDYYPVPTTTYHDGEVYRWYRFYMRQKKFQLAQQWISVLSDVKQLHAQLLRQHQWLETAFDLLLDFPGLWVGLELGNIRRHLALRCHEEFLSYLHHVHSTWQVITLSEEIAWAVDVGTVKALQVRAPSASMVDRDFIIAGMEARSLFPQITNDMQRAKITRAIIQLPVVIPTIKSLHENFKVLDIASRIIKQAMFNNRLNTTLYQAMRTACKPENFAVVETQEGEFHSIHAPMEDIKDIAYMTVFLSAFRNFAQLSYHSPKKENGQALLRGIPDASIRYQFLERLRLVGYSSAALAHNLATCEPTIPIRPSADELPLLGVGKNLRRRWAKPFTESYRIMNREMFLTHLSALHSMGGINHSNPSTMFVQQDLLRAFFGFTSVNFNAAVVTDLTKARTSHQRSWIREFWNFHSSAEAQLQSCSRGRPMNHADVEQSSARLDCTTGVAHQDVSTHRSTDITTNTTRSRAISLADNINDHQPGQQSISSGSMEISQYSITSSVASANHYGPHRELVSPTTVSSTGMPILSASSSSSHTFSRASTTSAMEKLVHQFGTTAVEVVAECATELKGFSTVERRPLLQEAQQSHKSLDCALELTNSLQLSPVSLSDKMPLVSPVSPVSLEVTRTDLETDQVREALSCSATSSLKSNLTLISDAGTLVAKESSQMGKSDKQSAKLSPQYSAAQVKRPYHWSRRSYFGQTQQKVARTAGSKNRRSNLVPRRRRTISTQKQFGGRLQGGRSFLPAPKKLPSSSFMPRVREESPEEQLESTAMDFVKDSGTAMQGRRSYLPALTGPQDGSDAKTEFLEHNGMTLALKSTKSITDYLKQRMGWVGLIVQGSEARSIRFEDIPVYLAEPSRVRGKLLALVKASYAEKFREDPMRSLQHMS